MTDATLQHLLTRVEAATGPDARLNAELTCAFILPGLRPAEPTDFDGKFGYSPGNIKVEHGFLQAHNLTGSVDEALALVERLLPNANWGIDKTDENDPEVWYDAIVGEGFAQHRKAAPAILAALLRALLARAEVTP